MATNDKSALPSYEESAAFQDQRPDGQRILDSLTTMRATHIRSTVNAHIYPHIEKRAERGLSQTVLALIPSNVMAVDEFSIKSGFSEGPVVRFVTTHFRVLLILGVEESSVTAMEIHSIVSDEDVNEVRLEGELNTYEFWKQRDVVQDLERVLRGKLSSSPLFSKGPKMGTEPEPLITTPTSPQPQPERRGFFGRRSSAKSSGKIAAPMVVQPVRSNRLDVKVDLEEVCLRTVSSFGLFETITRPAIVVRVKANC